MSRTRNHQGALAWSDDEVIKRHTTLYPRSMRGLRLADQAKNISQHKKQSAPDGIASFHEQPAEEGWAQGILPIAFDDYVQLAV